jgi:NADPH:quinone reductase-like Zn-dependent oxidoreductase
MHAIGFHQPGTIDRDEALIKIELPRPTRKGKDILVEVKAVSVNPIGKEQAAIFMAEETSRAPAVESWKLSRRAPDL